MKLGCPICLGEVYRGEGKWLNDVDFYENQPEETKAMPWDYLKELGIKYKLRTRHEMEAKFVVGDLSPTINRGLVKCIEINILL